MYRIGKNRKVFVGVGIVFLVGVVLLGYFYRRERKVEIEGYDLGSFDGGSVVESLDGVEGSENGDLGEVENDNGKKVDSDDSGEENNLMYIHIVGEVKNQGIVILSEGDRVLDAIEKAGGATEKADLSRVNLAFKLSDGQKVCVPNVNDKDDNFVFVYNDGGNSIVEDSNYINNKGKVNLNTATQTELETISGIGPSIAANIIQYRKENGKFKKIDELKNVNGIGESKYETIKKEVVVK